MKRKNPIIFLFAILVACILQAQTASASLIFQINVPAVCKMKIDSEYRASHDEMAVDFICNVNGSGYLSVINTARGTLSMTSDCKNSNTNLSIPLRLYNQRFFICDVQSQEKTLVTFTAL